MSTNRPTLNSLQEAPDKLWREGASILVPGLARSGAQALARAIPTGTILAVLPNARAALELAAALARLDAPASVLNELPLSGGLSPSPSVGLTGSPGQGPRAIDRRPVLLERGETMRRWARDGGTLAATPGALMAPCLLGAAEFPVAKGDNLRKELLDWLEANGYQRADLVWAPGQYAARGFIVDAFDPGHALPLRFEFLDDAVDRIASFHPATQRSGGKAPAGRPLRLDLDSAVLHSMMGTEPAQPAALIPEGAKVLLCDPKRIEDQALSFQWLWHELAPEAGLPLDLPGWERTFNALAAFPRLRLTGTAPDAEAELDLPPLEPAPDASSEAAALGLDEATAAGQRSPLEWRDRLSAGQLVVHEDYGTGVFRGVEQVVSMGREMDALVLEFAAGQRLLVPVLQSGKLTPLAEHESEDTQLDSLRGVRWKHSAERDRERAREEAKALMEIFARRELQRRPPWDEPGELYQKFVDAFPFEETADQLRAVNEIMADLSSPFPMDRLLVGDVGFGKTEVALRAAFRAVSSGYQACVLVPTTILAQQHFATFQARLAGFPVRVGLLSRFVPRKELAATLAAAGDGSVDILIGTHKLLQKGVKFKNLGLLVIDEEHRFGVMHKEGLKRAYGAVDILSLSATPIPRTLAMALRGLRSISVLSTPPADRLPVTTFTGPWQPGLVRKAIAYELNRGGQVYFLSNRISRMDEHKRMLGAFFPNASIQIAHGQMPEKELEAAMLDFYAGRTDILIATTIIESGLDVGRANTIVVDNAEELGLAQMYQLRGRVGRRGENAFAYFFYPEKAELRQETADRLEAISTMTELGSGYAIARRDLDIRGAGVVGGTSQHGSARANSFPLFYKMLEEELSRLRGFEKRMVDLTYDQGGSIPPFYIPQEGVRVTLYRRLLQAVGLDELGALAAEVRDRFGPMPEELRLLVALTAVRGFGGGFGLEKAVVGKGRTEAVGDMGELGPHLRKLPGWVALGTRAQGPGGLAGAEGLFTAMKEAAKG